MPEITDLTETPLFAPTANGHRPEPDVIDVGPPRTPEQLRADFAFALEQQILIDYETYKRAWVKVAAGLWRMQDGRHFTDLGYETFNEWIDQHPFGRSWVFELCQVYKAFVVDRAVDPERLARIDRSKAIVIEVAVRRNRVELDRALADAEAMPLTDLRDRYRELTRVAGAPEREKLEATEEPAWVRCYACNSRVREDRIVPPAPE